MSVNDPAIKDLKSCLQKFLYNNNDENLDNTKIIDDDNRYLSSFCQKLETIFYTGLNNKNRFFSIIEPYDWMLEIINDKNWDFSFYYLNSLYEIQKNELIKNKLGKFRMLIRYGLVYKCLHVPVDYLIKNKKLNRYYEMNNILGDEILSEIFNSVLLQCGTIKFNLDLKNIYFLEETWLLPDIEKIELVPTETLGVAVSFSEDKAVIVKLDPYGTAAENGKIQIGDILQNINGIQITSSSSGKLYQLMKKQKNQPINITLIKALKKINNNTLYIPIRKYLIDVNLDIINVQEKYKIGKDDSTNVAVDDDGNEKVKRDNKDGFRCTYVGCLKIGTEGDSKQIEKTIKTLIKHKYHNGEKLTNRFNKQILLKIDELSVKIVDVESGYVVFSHAYMDISSCGSSNIYYNYFGYIKGNDKDEPGQFTCFIFYTKNDKELITILSSIGQGFKRTTYAV